MEGGRKRRLTAEEKGKGVMPQQKKKTQEEKDAESALHSAHATDLQERGIRSQLQIRGSTPPPTQTLIQDEYSLSELALKVGNSVVTIAAVTSATTMQQPSFYGTGFILISQKNYAVVFTSFPPEKDLVKDYFVYFEGSNVRNKAHVLTSDRQFLILIIQTNKEYAPVTFRDHPLDRELVFTVGATGGIRLYPNGKVIDESVGSVAVYRGKVAVSSYAALNLEFLPIKQAEIFFELTCSAHDELINLKNIDKKVPRTTNTVLCAPVFCFGCQVGGIIFSAGKWSDVKCGLHAKNIILHIQRMCGTRKKNWQEQLQKLADDWMLKNTNHHP